MKELIVIRKEKVMVHDAMKIYHTFDEVDKTRIELKMFDYVNHNGDIIHYAIDPMLVSIIQSIRK